MQEKIMSLIAERTGGKSFKARKYCLDNIQDTSYEDEPEFGVHWKKKAENRLFNKYISLKKLYEKIIVDQKSLLTYFLDGSRSTFRVDDITYTGSGGRKVIYPIVAGQIGVACTKRIEKKLSCENFNQEFVIAMPDIANADGKAGFFPALVQKINEINTIKNFKIQFSSILPYKTAQGIETKFEDRAIACIQDRMIKAEKEMVNELVRKRKLDQDNYLVKDGSIEYRASQQELKDKRKYQTQKNNYAWVLGVSKKFNPALCIDVNGKSNPGFIADLPLFHRTPAAYFENYDLFGEITFAFWYVRIRDRKIDTPFDGIVKVLILGGVIIYIPYILLNYL